MSTRYIQKRVGAASHYTGDDAGIGYDTTLGKVVVNPLGTVLVVPTVNTTTSRERKIAVVPLSGTALHAAVVGWQNPEGAAIIVLRAIADITTVSTGACTLDVGVTAVSATTTSDTLFDGIDANAAIAVFDSGNHALDSGANAKAQAVASGKWVTIDEKTGDATGLVGNLFIEYILA